jgi:hypothetical protein
MGTWVILYIPAPINASVSRPIINLLLIEKSMILLIIDKGVNSVEILVLYIELNAMHNVDESNRWTRQNRI